MAKFAIFAVPLTSAALIVAGLANSPLPSQADTTARSYVVMLKATAEPGSRSLQTTTNQAIAKAERLGATIEHRYEGLGGYSAAMTPRQAADLTHDPNVASVSVPPTFHIADLAQPQASDFWPDKAWGLERIAQRERPTTKTPFKVNATGSGVHAYILDTGILKTHAEFTGRVSNGYDFVYQDDDPQDDHNMGVVRGHGTMTASIVGGTTWGVAKQVTLHAVKVLDSSGNGKGANVLAGIDWIVKNGVRPGVVNMSISADRWEPEDQAVQRLVQAGFSVVTAAGNSRDDACKHSPAGVKEILTVAASDDKDRIADQFSSWGACVDLFAPGFMVGGASNKDDTAVQAQQGTSQSSPYVAGAVAGYLQGHPKARMDETHTFIVNSSTKDKISGNLNGTPNRLLYTGELNSTGTPTPFPPDPVSPAPTTSAPTSAAPTTAPPTSIPVTTPPATTPTKPTTATNSATNELRNGQAITFALRAGKQNSYVINIPAEAKNLVIKLSGDGDADLYAKAGATPTSSSYDCRPWLSDSNESCSFATPAPGKVGVLVAGATSAKKLTLVATWETKN